MHGETSFNLEMCNNKKNYEYDGKKSKNEHNWTHYYYIIIINHIIIIKNCHDNMEDNTYQIFAAIILKSHIQRRS